MSNKTDQNTSPFPNSSSYARDAVPPPGPFWEKLKGVENAKICLLSLYVIENSGIRLLAAILRKHGFRVHEIYFKDWYTNRIDPPTEKEIKALLQEIHKVDPDIIGMSVRASAFHRMATSITEQIRSELGIPILWGGMHVTSCPEDAIRVADIVCIGEAEDILLKMMQCLRDEQDISEMPGLFVHTQKGITRNDTAPLVCDLDDFPFSDFHSPDKSFIEEGRVSHGDPCIDEAIYLIMASRGCPFPSCHFCSNSLLDRVYPNRKRLRMRSVQHVLDEVEYAKKHFKHLHRIRFDDEEFPVQKEWFDEFCRRWPVEAGMPFEIHMDPRAITAENVQCLKDVGLDMVFMGIQSTEQINRELYGRDVSDARILECAEILHKIGVRVGYQVILDDPVSTNEDKRQLFELLLKLPRPYEMVLFSLTVYPGSALAEDLIERGLITDDDVEGPATKVFKQFRVDLSYPRPAEDRFWTALIVLVSKSFVPKALLSRLGNSKWFRFHPTPVVIFAYVANIIKIGIMAFLLLVRGELSWKLVKRWLSLKSLVTF